MKYTDRSLRMIEFAEMEAERTAQIVYPVHLLLGILLDRTGAGAELHREYPSLIGILNERMREIYSAKEEKGVIYKPFTIHISQTTKMVMENARYQMKRFKQLYVNEGHIVDAIFKVNDSLTSAIFAGLDVSRILDILSHPRDMIVFLKDYSTPTIPTGGITFRKAKQSDAAALKIFVGREFGSGWIESVSNGFSQKDIPIYIALEGKEITGFACFDVVGGKRGVFGPMGTSLAYRIQGIGYTLLHYCLSEMKEIGYEYAVIGEAGPLEFYEKTCSAVVIPRNSFSYRSHL
ncbi:GNAT family N-acetyltransferase [Bacillus lacus]|uniref:GNAT family N-acetyltransferase n=1 Tax=Metabacillus lacus TaxID=1983721 RepID=A0A7X2IZ36_9BACI|nr:GNAT family N-acetyltransferase [Metabacillus lacus]MRX72325.1 GNAT family N-acetyltransferase [Metabacillus lacus]